MNLLSGLALILLTLVGYSSGSALVGRGRKVAPGIWDVCAVLLLWGGAWMTRAALGRGWAILVWLLLGMAVGAVFMAARRNSFPKPKAWEVAVPKPASSALRRVWNGWMAFSHEMGDYQGRILLIFFYFVVVTPFAVLVRLFSDPLKIRHKEVTSYWLERAPIPAKLDEVRRQF